MSDNNDPTPNEPSTPNGDGIMNKIGLEAPKEVSAATVGRMMGLATISDLKLLDSKVDLVATKITGLMLKVEKILTHFASAPTGSDLERIDVQIGNLRTLLKDAVSDIKESIASGKK